MDQPASGGNRNYQFRNKGLEFVTSSRTQILIGVPTSTLVSPNGPPGGFVDLPLMLKFRISSAERTEGNYLVTFLLAATAPTGSHRYGAGEAVVTPTMALDKGRRRFDVQSTVGVNLPAGDTAKLGRQLPSNNGTGGMETLARTGSELHVLHDWEICWRDATVPDPRTWIWARTPCGTISAVVCGGPANRRDPVPYLQSSLDVFDPRLVLNTLAGVDYTAQCIRSPTRCAWRSGNHVIAQYSCARAPSPTVSHSTSIAQVLIALGGLRRTRRE